MIKKIVETLAIGLTALMLLTVSPVLAQQKSQPKQHVVKSGETLYSIAQQYNVSVQDLMKWNHLNSNDIQIGQQLLIGPPQQETTGARKQSTVKHMVEKGETLFSIARQYGVTVAQLKSWNNLQNNSLHVGQILEIHKSGKQSQPATAGNNNPPPSPKTTFLQKNSGQTQIYTVKKGDYLALIAQRFNMTVNELKELNQLKSNVIHVGQQLRVTGGLSAPSVAENTKSSSPQGRFATYEVKRNQPLSDLLKNFQMDEYDFRALNPDFQGNQLSRGQKILVLLPPTVHHTDPYRVDNQMKRVGITPAEVYPDSAIGTPTTSGQLYNPNSLTAGNATLPLGKVVYVENPQNGKGLYVVINDRIPGNDIKLSRKAYQELGLRAGQPGVKITEVQ